MEESSKSTPLIDKIKNLYSRFSEFSNKYSYIGCAFIIPIIVFWTVYICFEVYPFGNNSVLVLDLNGQYVYFFEALRNAMHGDTSLIYSWSRSLGGEFIGIYAYYIASPLSFLVYFFSENHITEALLTIILLKTGISGATMAFYLKKTRPITKDLGVVIFSTMYALSAYAVTYAHNTMWIDAMMLLPLLFYGLEKLITEHKFKLFTVTLTLILISTFYIGYMVCFFVFIYFFYYYFVSGANYGNNYYGEKLHFVKSLVRVGLSSAASILMACFIIFPTYYSLTFGKTTFTKTVWKFASQFDLIDFFAKMLPGSYDTVRPEGLPFVYCGVLALIMLPVFFASRKIHPREKIGAAAILTVTLFCMNFMVVDTFLHGMQRPNWLNYRYSFVFIFLVVVFACRAFEQIQTVKPAFLCCVGAVIIALILVVQKVGFSHLDSIKENIDFSVLDDYFCIWFAIICVIAYLISLRYVIASNGKNITLSVLSILVCLELFGSSVVTSVNLDKDVGMSSRQGYVDYFNRVRNIVSSVQESDKSFYRMEKTIARTVCDDFALNIKGLSSSTSTLNASVIEFLNNMGYASSSHWSRYAGGTMVSDSLLGLKYIISESNTGSDLLSPYMSDEPNNLYAYLNEYALSMAFSSSPDIRSFDLTQTAEDPTKYASPFEVMNDLVTALTGSEEKIELFKPIEYTLNLDNAFVSYNGRVNETITDPDGTEHKIQVGYLFYEPQRTSSPGKMTYSFSIDPSLENADVYFFFCSNYPREVSWTLSGTEENLQGTFFGNESDCIQSLGVLEKDTQYRLSVTMNEKDNIFYIIKDAPIFYYLDHEVFKDVFTSLAEGNWHIDDNYSDTHLTGTVNVPAGDSVMFTSIPYDEGWNVYVDGEKVEIIKLANSLLGFDITEGEHTIEMRYFSKAMLYGIICTSVGVLMFAVLIIIDHFVFAPKRKGKHEEWLVRVEELKSEQLMREKMEQERSSPEDVEIPK